MKYTVEQFLDFAKYELRVASEHLQPDYKELHTNRAAMLTQAAENLRELERVRKDVMPKRTWIEQIWAQSGNYIADSEFSPTTVYFRNNRIVKVVDGKLSVERATIFPDPSTRSIVAEVFERREMRKLVVAALAANKEPA